MTFFLKKLIAKLFSNPVYHTLPTKELPQYVYFYYLKPGTSGHTSMTVHVIDMGVRQELTQAMIEGYVTQVDQGTLPSKGTHVAVEAWQYYCYLAFVLKDPNASLEVNNAVVFTLTIPPKGGNRTFRNGKTISGSSIQHLSGMWCINHRLTWQGNALGPDDTETFSVDFPGIDEHRVHNEAGSNTGP